MPPNYSKDDNYINFGFRIDNSGCSVIYNFDHKSETVLVIITCIIPNKRDFFFNLLI